MKYHCMKCGSDKVIWECDYDYSDFGYEGEGIVSCYHCQNCGADIRYEETFTEETEDE